MTRVRDFGATTNCSCWAASVWLVNPDAEDRAAPITSQSGQHGVEARVPSEAMADGGALASREAPKWKVFSWAMWDWGTQPFATVITTFVFSVYLTSEIFGSENYTSTMLGWAMGIAGLFIALLAPVLGQGSDRSGRRMTSLLWQTILLAVLSASLWFVAPDPSYFVLGLVLLGVGNVIAEMANVNYYASIENVATPRTVGRVSGLGWGLGYLGGITILLVIVAIRGMEFGPDDVRFAMLLCGAWAIFCIPIFIALRDDKEKRAAYLEQRQDDNRSTLRRVADAYVQLGRSVKELYRESPNTVYFLLASALFRDGLSGVFTFGAVLARGTFGFTFGEVILFGVAANVTAGVATIIFGFLDDKVGPKKIMMFSLISLVILGMGVFIFHDHGPTYFWVLGLALCLFVGPTQSASRSFLVRATPEGKAGQVFGLYATTGRAVSFISPLMWSAFILLGAWITGSEETQYFGILGIMVVLLVGLLALIPVKEQGYSFTKK